MAHKHYPKVMLPTVHYHSLEDDGMFDELTDLEYGIMRNLSDFVEDLKDILLQEKLMQNPELMVAHLCGYLGFLTVASLGIKQATALQAEIMKLLEDQAKISYEIFCKHPVNADLAEAEKTKNLDQLRANSPGSLVVQTVRLGKAVWNSIRELSRNRNLYFGFIKEKQTELFCPQKAFIILLKKTSSKTIRDLKNGVPIIYFLNQMTVHGLRIVNII